MSQPTVLFQWTTVTVLFFSTRYWSRLEKTISNGSPLLHFLFFYALHSVLFKSLHLCCQNKNFTNLSIISLFINLDQFDLCWMRKLDYHNRLSEAPWSTLSEYKNEFYWFCLSLTSLLIRSSVLTQIAFGYVPCSHLAQTLCRARPRGVSWRAWSISLFPKGAAKALVIEMKKKIIFILFFCSVFKRRISQFI